MSNASNNLSTKNMAISGSPTLAIDAKFKELKANGEDALGFGVGEPDFDTPLHIKQAAIKAINDGFTKYTPASGTLTLKKAICAKLKNDNNLDYTPAEIVVNNGAKHSLVNALSAILNPGDEVIIPAPFWVSYPEMVKIADGVPVVLPTTEENNFKFTLQDLKNKISAKTKAIIINSPSNPTGMIYTEDELRDIADLAVEKGIYIISDEIYEKLIYNGKHVSIASFNDQIKDLTIIVNGVSKSYAMTGWRIGYTASNAQIAKIMSNIQSHMTSNPCSISQAAAVAALEGDQSCVDEMRAEFLKRRNYVVEAINKIPQISCLNADGAFYVMINISKVFGTTLNGVKINSATDFCNALLDAKKVALVPGEGFDAPNYCRMSYATSISTIEKGIARIDEFLNGR
ncbi:MAG: pyridoxal phosphate-dependent aminotransferase [Clostridiales bacterium]|jgi:aspartate aminotransferase|nr:pyridoxal phosphate-dependent aminotransferase [Clostridiales bacterium]